MKKYNRLKDLRTDNDKTQEEIAKVIGTTAQYYSAYERGERDIPFERIIKLAKYYNVTIDYIAGLTNEPNKLSQKQNVDINQNKHNINNNNINNSNIKINIKK